MDPAIFASSFYPYKGGVEQLVRQLALTRLREGGHPLVVSMRWPKSLPANEVSEGIPVRRWVFRTPERGFKRVLGTWASGPTIISGMASALRADGSQVVHVQCVSANGWYARRVARRLDLPLVVTLQGELTMDADRVYERSRVLPPLLGQLLREADVVTACSEATLREAERFTGVDVGDRGHVVHNGVRVADFADAPTFQARRPYVLGIGRLVPQKGFDVLLRAIAEVDDSLDLVIAGPGSEADNLRRLAADLGLADRVSFLGPVDRSAVPSLFAGATAFVLSSRHEPFGIVNLEAMAAGVPVIATDVGGVSEFVKDGVNGLLVPAEDHQAIASAIEKVMSDDSLRRELVQAGLGTAQEHDWEAIAAQYQALYRGAVR